MAMIRLPASPASLYFGQPVGSSDVLPSNEPAGTMRVVLDTSAVYVSNGNSYQLGGITNNTGTMTPAVTRILTSADIPNLDASKITTGTIPVAQGGTNSSNALAGSRIMISANGAIVEGPALTDGQLLAGRTGAGMEVTSVVGTTNQISASFVKSTGNIVLSCPQNIDTGATPSFAGLNLSANLTVAGSVKFGSPGFGLGSALIRTSNGSIFELTSSLRHKENIKPLRETLDPKAILDLEGKTFNYKKQTKENVCFGFIAEEVEKISKKLVIYDEDDRPYSLQYTEFIPIMLELIKDQRAEIQQIKDSLNVTVETINLPKKWKLLDYLKAFLTLGVVKPA